MGTSSTQTAAVCFQSFDSSAVKNCSFFIIVYYTISCDKLYGIH
ncbi:hypothetical protein EVA_18682 [gut metagenome]|uniref:Uncharacterized protein n=1 Tax=gut metagenome TaxID=749906 RepID=J9FE72_9ZZZZ